MQEGSIKVKIALAQIDVVIASPAANLAQAADLMRKARAGGAEMLCFPEMWTTGFDYQANLKDAGACRAVLDQIGKLAQNHGLWVHGSVSLPDDTGRMTNTALLFAPDGKAHGEYRKIHLFGLIGEDRHTLAGDLPVTVETPWGLAGQAICYDLRFPELFRMYAVAGAQLIFCPSAFPAVRRDHWRTLIRARAIENQVFVVAVNQVGTEELNDGQVLTYGGASAVISPSGQALVEADEHSEELVFAELDMGEVAEIRARMNTLADRRPDVYA